MLLHKYVLIQQKAESNCRSNENDSSKFINLTEHVFVDRTLIPCSGNWPHIFVSSVIVGEEVFIAFLISASYLQLVLI